MIVRKHEQTVEYRHNVRGGAGSPAFCHLFSQEQTGGRTELLAVITLQPGESIGVHGHETNAEVYYVLTGCVTVTDDGAVSTLQPGDAMFCGDGHTHSMANATDEPVSVLAAIVPNR